MKLEKAVNDWNDLVVYFTNYLDLNIDTIVKMQHLATEDERLLSVDDFRKLHFDASERVALLGDEIDKIDALTNEPDVETEFPLEDKEQESSDA